MFFESQYETLWSLEAHRLDHEMNGSKMHIQLKTAFKNKNLELAK